MKEVNIICFPGINLSQFPIVDLNLELQSSTSINYNYIQFSEIKQFIKFNSLSARLLKLIIQLVGKLLNYYITRTALSLNK